MTTIARRAQWQSGQSVGDTQVWCGHQRGQCQWSQCTAFCQQGGPCECGARVVEAKRTGRCRHKGAVF